MRHSPPAYHALEVPSAHAVQGEHDDSHTGANWSQLVAQGLRSAFDDQLEYLVDGRAAEGGAARGRGNAEERDDLSDTDWLHAHVPVRGSAGRTTGAGSRPMIGGTERNLRLESATLSF
jgi:hypothetical protein